MQRDEIHMAAWAAHHDMRRGAVNIYANTRRVAGLMHAFEDDDFRLKVGGGTGGLADPVAHHTECARCQECGCVPGTSCTP